MDVATGLTFNEARKRIGESFRGVVSAADRLEGARPIDWAKHCGPMLPAMGVAALFIAAVIIGGTTNYVEYIILVLVISVVSALNAALEAMYRKSESLEVSASLKGILEAYESAYEAARKYVPLSVLGSSASLACKELSKAYLSSGHSQVSIVHVFRDNQWLRLPVLLLAEGDIIALMGGDITPGQCYEIERVKSTNVASFTDEHTHDADGVGGLDAFDTAVLGEGAPGKNGGTCWKLGKLMEAGEKVHIRNRQQFSQQKPSNHRGGGVSHEAHVESPAPAPAAVIAPLQGVVAGVEQLHFGERHRSLGPESVEILSLSGDVRCFRMAETPITSFLRHTVLGQAHSAHSQHAPPKSHHDGYSYVSPATAAGTDEQDAHTHTSAAGSEDGVTTMCAGGSKNSLVRTIFQEIVIKEGHRVFALVIVLTILAAVIRAVLIHVGTVNDVTRGAWSLSILVPVATACVFFLPLALPATLVLMEALATADVLASAEVTLRPTVAKPAAPVIPIMLSLSWWWPGRGNQSRGTSQSAAPPQQASGGASNHKIASNAGSGDETSAFLRDDHSAGSKAGRKGDRDRDRKRPREQDPSGEGSGAEGSDGAGPEVEDEFQDEDIDERAEDIAEEVSTQVRWSRYFAYTWRVLHHRLLLGVMHSSAAVRDESDFLPIPLARNRLLEVLGAVTMVCFVDDDVICEGFSVTEEIFLLMDDPQHSSADTQKHTAGAASANQRNERTGSVDDTSGAVAFGTAKGPQVAGGTGTAKGMVLDLHANPEATGSRFENPQWWRYLPSLKPLGLNAMLTYSYGTHASNEEATAGKLRAQGVLSPNADMVAGESTHRKRALSALPYPQSVQSPSVASPGVADVNHSLHLTQQQSERSLVRHIRHLLPLESLRELAEEIGFEQADLSPFARVLEVNVLAPGLENAHLLEDTHQWGQEESRRRGSLLPQLRGGVYKDFRDGSLQMMCLGDPSLVLNYCREYWDGSTKSITPLSSADRAEVLSVFERWRLEDFEVVAFCYSPLPTGGLQPLLSKEDAQSQAAIAGLSTRHNSASISASGQPQGRVTSGSNAGAHGRSSFSIFPPSGHLASFSAPFVPAKHNTLFFVDPITTQDLHRIAAGITSKTRGGQATAAARKKQTESDGALQGGQALPAVSVADKRSPTHKSHLAGEEVEVEQDGKGQGESGVTGMDFALDDGGDLFPLTHEGHDMMPPPPISINIVRSPQLGVPSPIITKTGVSGHGGEDQDQLGITTEQPRSALLHAALVDSSYTHAQAAAGGRKASRSDASYLPSMPLCLMKGGTLVKSVSLDRVQEYQRYDHQGLGAHTTDSLLNKRHGEDGLSVAGSEAEALLMPLPRPLRTSTSARELGVKDTSENRRFNAAATQSHTPVLLFPDDDDMSTVTASTVALSPYPAGTGMSAGAGTGSLRDSKRGTAAGVRFARHASDAGFASTTKNQVGLSVDVESIADRSHESILTPLSLPEPGSIQDALLLDAAADAGGRSTPTRGLTTSRSLGGGSLTPPLVPRGHNQHHHHHVTKTSTVNALLSPQLRHHASEYIHPVHTRLAMQQQIQNSRQRQQQQQQRSHQQHRQMRRASTRQLWTLMRQQVFLGMAASSVPVRKDVPNIKEDLDSAGVRFVYFSAQNMKRSKPVAEKIGIPFDWNCAISLRELEGGTAQDPHRHISNYADWDVLAHMPHGIEAIKAHIHAVDNVPLLVSLFTDATPLTVRQMVEVFRDNGEVVLSIGGGYRSHNHPIYHSSDLSCSVSVLPGLENTTSLLPASEEELVMQFPEHSDSSLSRADILLSFRLIGLTTINLLQTPYRADLASPVPDAIRCDGSPTCVCKQCVARDFNSEEAEDAPFRIDMPVESHLGKGNSPGPIAAENVRLSVLLETIRKGRIILRNLLQVLAFFCVATLSLGLWPLVSLVVPISLPPSPPPGIALLFQLVYVPVLCVTLLQCGEPEGVMKNTPRKNQLQRRPKDLQRFCSYLLARCAFVLLSIALVGWAAAASTMRTGDTSFRASLGKFYYLDSREGADTQALRLVQDLMTTQALLSLLSQSSTLVVRGQSALSHFPWPWRLPESLYYVVALALMGVQAGIMVLREDVQGGRGTSATHPSTTAHTYDNLDWPVWLLMVLLPAVGVLLGVVINGDDDHHYRRYLQFLRLEFETRLGMHSPR